MATKTPRRRRRVHVPWGRIGRIALVSLFAAAFLAVAGVVAVTTWPSLFVWAAERMPRRPLETYKSDEEFFKYGSIGNEAVAGLPYKVWAVLPKVCGRLVGKDGYKSFGFVYEPGKRTPIGLSRVSIGGIEQIAINCSVCHVNRYRLSPDGKPEIFVGGVSNTLDGQAYQRFIFGCAATRGFETDTVLAAMREESDGLGWLEEQLFRVVIPVVRKLVLEESKSFAWTWKRPLWGPGRVDPFNQPKFTYLGQPIDDTIGNSDMMPAWDATLKESIRPGKTPWHWDGLSGDLREVIINSALGDLMTVRGYEAETIERLLGYLHALKSPKAPVTADPVLQKKGEDLFKPLCANCHAPDGSRMLTLIPIAEIGTDDHRLGMWTQAATDAYNKYDKDTTDRAGKPLYPWTLDRFAKNEAYLAQPLGGIWLTAPYLHNGSVPTLDDLLKPAAERPKAFVRGLETIDLKRGGYDSPVCNPQSHAGPGFCYDTRLPGNANGGHEYGAGLGEADRHALVHYILTR